jgi:Prokaryotic E2 family E/Multiubiquitin
MSSNYTNEQNGQDDKIVKVDLEEVFHGKQTHCEDHDPGTIVYYVFKVDKQSFEKREFKWNGKELLALVGLTPDKYRLFQIGEGQKEILPDDVIDIRKCGVERFKSVAKFANEGKEAAAIAASSLRRMIELLPEDVAFLDRYFPKWETLHQGGTGWIFIHDFKVPEAYNVGAASVAFMIPPSYPTTEFDMMYFYPALSRKDSQPIGALNFQALDAKNFQRWSRHRNAGDWRSGIDNLETHVLSVQSWLIDELKKR